MLHQLPGGVFLHGLTDSPYSLRHLAALYRDRGFIALGIRLPAHGTVPAALSKVTWDWNIPPTFFPFPMWPFLFPWMTPCTAWRRRPAQRPPIGKTSTNSWKRASRSAALPDQAVRVGGRRSPGALTPIPI